MSLKKEKEDQNKTPWDNAKEVRGWGTVNLGFYLQWNYHSKIKVKLKTFLDKQKLRVTVASMPASQEIAKEALPPEGKITTDSMLEMQEEIKDAGNGKCVDTYKELHIIFFFFRFF